MFADFPDIFQRISAAFFGPGVRLFPIYLISTVFIAFILFLFERPKKSFFSWLAPAHIYLHKSHLTDFKLFLVGRALTFLGLFGFVSLSSLTAAFFMDLIGPEVIFPFKVNLVFIGLFLVLVSDFGVYLVHRAHHEWPLLWPFHSVHHSAEVLTPVTVYRKHPVYDISSTVVKSLLLGFFQGVLVGLFVGKVSLEILVGFNAVYALFHLLGSNLRHTHLWLSYGEKLEHIFISPAQHQIHHSVAPKHMNKNYGEIFAIWDWMFGTLYIPKTQENLVFGLPDDPNLEKPQPHPTLTKALVSPFQESWKVLKGWRPLPQKARE